MYSIVLKKELGTYYPRNTGRSASCISSLRHRCFSCQIWDKLVSNGTAGSPSQQQQLQEAAHLH